MGTVFSLGGSKIVTEIKEDVLKDINDGIKEGIQEAIEKKVEEELKQPIIVNVKLSNSENKLMLGNHYILDIKNIPERKFLNGENTIAVFEKILIENGATVINKIYYDFPKLENTQGEPTTLLFLLAESHLSLHTWPENNCASLDVYTCGTKVNTKKIVDDIINWFETKEYILNYVERGIS
jgi:S-adenosylmethionine decarboxylase proenzyme